MKFTSSTSMPSSSALSMKTCHCGSEAPTTPIFTGPSWPPSDAAPETVSEPEPPQAASENVRAVAAKSVPKRRTDMGSSRDEWVTGESPGPRVALPAMLWCHCDRPERPRTIRHPLVSGCGRPEGVICAAQRAMRSSIPSPSTSATTTSERGSAKRNTSSAGPPWKRLETK